MLFQSIEHCVKSPPWRIAIPAVGKTIEMGDIIHGICGALVLSIFATPVALIAGGIVLIPAAMLGIGGGLMVRRFSPGQTGWRNFFSAFLSHHLRRKQAYKEETTPESQTGGVVYLSMWSSPVFLRLSKAKRGVLISRHVPVGTGYKPRSDV